MLLSSRLASLLSCWPEHWLRNGLGGWGGGEGVRGSGVQGQLSVIHPVPAQSRIFFNGPDPAQTQNLPFFITSPIFWHLLGLFSFSLAKTQSRTRPKLFSTGSLEPTQGAPEWAGGRDVRGSGDDTDSRDGGGTCVTCRGRRPWPPGARPPPWARGQARLESRTLATQCMEDGAPHL